MLDILQTNTISHSSSLNHFKECNLSSSSNLIGSMILNYASFYHRFIDAISTAKLYMHIENVILILFCFWKITEFGLRENVFFLYCIPLRSYETRIFSVTRAIASQVPSTESGSKMSPIFSSYTANPTNTIDSVFNLTNETTKDEQFM